jgi:hypothetical protein
MHALVQSSLADLARIQDVDHPETTFRLLIAAYFAARQGDAAMATNLLARDLVEAKAGAGYPVISQMRKVVEAEIFRAGGEPDRAVATLKPMVDGTELQIVRVALMDAYAEAKQDAAALEQARWLSTHRGRAYAEANVQRMLTPFNVVQTDLALLREAELSSALGMHDEARRALSDFERAWPEAGAIDYLRARLATLRAAVPTREGPAPSRT